MNLKSPSKTVKIVLAIILIAFTPFIFTRPSPSFIGVVFSDKTGVIGDTIGGITAPFINLLAAYLVYISFKEQVKANKILSKETSYNFIRSLYNDINNDYNSLLLKDSYNFNTLNHYNKNEFEEINRFTFESYCSTFLNTYKDLQYHSENIKTLLVEILYNNNISNSIKKTFSSRLDDFYNELKQIKLKSDLIITYIIDNHYDLESFIKNLNKDYNINNYNDLINLIQKASSSLVNVEYYKNRISELK